MFAVYNKAVFCVNYKLHLSYCHDLLSLRGTNESNVLVGHQLIRQPKQLNVSSALQLLLLLLRRLLISLLQTFQQCALCKDQKSLSENTQYCFLLLVSIQLLIQSFLGFILKIVLQFFLCVSILSLGVVCSLCNRVRVLFFARYCVASNLLLFLFGIKKG